jgi:hypothetical protein
MITYTTMGMEKRWLENMRMIMVVATAMNTLKTTPQTKLPTIMSIQTTMF